MMKSSINISPSIPLLTRTIKRVKIDGVVYVSDTITNHITGKTYDTPKRKKKQVWSVS